jgi:hypothetical protein
MDNTAGDDAPTTMTIDSLDQATPNEAMRALTTAARPDDNAAADDLVVLGVIGTRVSAWRLAAAHMTVACADVIGWDPDLAATDGFGLIVATDTGAVYRFATDRPQTLPVVDPTIRPVLRIVREAS